MLVFKNYLKGVLTQHVNIASNELPINPAFIKRLVKDMEVGDYVYISLLRDDTYEIVKFTYTPDSYTERSIIVDRDVENKGRSNFHCGAVVKVDWVDIQLREFIEQVKK